MKRQAFLVAAMLLILTACSGGEAPPSALPDTESGIPVVSQADESASQEPSSPKETSSSQASAAMEPSSTGEGSVQDNVSTPGELPPPEDTPVDVEQALADQLVYLEQTLTDAQHGGIHRTSDYNGSGLATHGGADRADPYILIWVVDQLAVDSALASYPGPSVEVTCKGAHYSQARLDEILDELRGSEIAPYVNSFAAGVENRVLISVNEDNRERVEDFLTSYANRDAVVCYYVSASAENPDT